MNGHPMIRAALALATLACLPIAAGHAEGLKVQPGLWETTFESPMTGANTERQCMTETELDPAKMIKAEGDGCEITEQSLSGNTLTYQMACPDNLTGSGKMTFEQDRGSAEIRMLMPHGDQPMEMTISLQAKRIGDC